ncbi:MAG: TRAM domain-containing protein [Candidatus Saccharimonadales bacterium]
MLDIIEIGILIVIIYVLLKDGRFTHNRKTGTVIMDSCALIDGRVVSLARSGFMPETVIIPEFILSELQMLADGRDGHKRDRARYGLDVVRELQDSRLVNVDIDRASISSKQKTDDKLVVLAKRRQASLYTTDYNLAKIADIEGVKILNINELAKGLRRAILPGEKLTIKVLQKGSNPGQGVGYLDDGTMVVVEHGTSYIGKDVLVAITRTHQTTSGRMVFAEIEK